MIIPTLYLKSQRHFIDGTLDSNSLKEAIQNWSLFGRIAIREVESSMIETLETVFASVGGSVDLIVDLGESEADALTLLNAGASLVLCSPDELDTFELIPVDRTFHCLAQDMPDQAIPARHFVALQQPTADRIAELEMARVDSLVAADVLDENVAMIVDFFKTVLVTDRPDGLWATVIVDPMGVALGLAYSNEESLSYAIENRVGAYYSRSRDDLWIKGESSGATQSLIEIRFDCDRDCLRFRVAQAAPGFCHRDTYTCFGPQRTIQSVTQRLSDRIHHDTDEKSFTRKLASDPSMLEAKLLEEAKELAEAQQAGNPGEVTFESADVLYFSLVAMIKRGVALHEVHEELARRMNRVVRRKNKLEPNDPS